MQSLNQKMMHLCLSWCVCDMGRCLEGFKTIPLLEKGLHKISISSTERRRFSNTAYRQEIIKWAEESLMGDFIFCNSASGDVVAFEFEDDALLFKLTWA